jgi:CRISPR-associated protein Csb2
MLTVSVELVHGLMRASTADDTALTGDGSIAEWPPSPARLFSALVAAAGTGDRPPADVGVLGLDLLSTAAPAIYASSLSEVAVSDVRDRFVVVDERAEGSVQNYPARKAQKIAPGSRVCPRSPHVVYEWPEVSATPGELAALRYRAARVPYLGCSDSPAIVTVSAESPPTDLPRWEPNEAGSMVLPVPDEGFLDRLDVHFQRWSQGAPVRRSWLATELRRYCDPDEVAARNSGQPFTVWLRFGRPISGRRLVLVAETLRAAVLSHVDRLVGGRDHVPEVVHGHLSVRGPGSHGARWLPLPTVGSEHADGRIRGACIWLPATATSAERELVRQAATCVDELILPGVFATPVSVFDGTTRPWTSHPKRWSGPARRWATATPAVHDRHSRHGLTLEQVARWCEHAGLPEPVWFRSSPAPLLDGSLMVTTADLGRPGRLAGPRSFVELEFALPVNGPVVIGRGRGFGLGICSPIESTRSS